MPVSKNSSIQKGMLAHSAIKLEGRENSESEMIEKVFGMSFTQMTTMGFRNKKKTEACNCLPSVAHLRKFPNESLLGIGWTDKVKQML